MDFSWEEKETVPLYTDCTLKDEQERLTAETDFFCYFDCIIVSLTQSAVWQVPGRVWGGPSMSAVETLILYNIFTDFESITERCFTEGIYFMIPDTWNNIITITIT